MLTSWDRNPNLTSVGCLTIESSLFSAWKKECFNIFLYIRYWLPGGLNSWEEQLYFNVCGSRQISPQESSTHGGHIYYQPQRECFIVSHLFGVAKPALYIYIYIYIYIKALRYPIAIKVNKQKLIQNAL